MPRLGWQTHLSALRGPPMMPRTQAMGRPPTATTLVLPLLLALVCVYGALAQEPDGATQPLLLADRFTCPSLHASMLPPTARQLAKRCKQQVSGVELLLWSACRAARGMPGMPCKAAPSTGTCHIMLLPALARFPQHLLLRHWSR